MAYKKSVSPSSKRRSVNPAANHHAHIGAGTRKKTSNVRSGGQKRTFLFASLIAIALFSGWFLLVRLIIPTVDTVTTVQPVPFDFENSQEIVNTALPDAKGSKLEITSALGVGGTTRDGLVAYMAAPYKTPGSPFFVLPAESTGSAYAGDSEEASSDYSRFKDFLKNKGFTYSYGDKELSRPAILDGSTETVISQESYESERFVCLIQHSDASLTLLARHIASIACAEKNSYSAATTVLKHLYDAYSGTSSSTTGFVIGLMNSGIGKDGYEYVITYQEDPSANDDYMLGYYYKKSTDKTWKYHKSFQEQPHCSDFDDMTLKMAFSGVECIDQVSSQKRKV